MAPKLALTAVARQLLVLLNAILRDQRPWQYAWSITTQKTRTVARFARDEVFPSAPFPPSWPPRPS
jgi:hypothetical protein